MIILETRGVRFKHLVYPDMQIAQGDTTFVSGQSGCGKSTLLKLFNSILSCDEGEILYKGKNAQSFSPTQLRQEVLLCAQSVFLFDKTIEQNFSMFYEFREVPLLSRDAMNGYLRLCLAQFSPDAQCSVLSGGERQRVFIAICLSLQPTVLLLDEPTSALDDQSAMQLIGNIQAHCKQNEITPIIVSHNIALGKAFADHTLFLERTAQA